MDKIFMDAKDKNVAKIVVYADAEGNLFYDAEKSVEVPSEDCIDLFMKGVVALMDGTYYQAVSCTDAGVIDFGLAD